MKLQNIQYVNYGILSLGGTVYVGFLSKAHPQSALFCYIVLIAMLLALAAFTARDISEVVSMGGGRLHILLSCIAAIVLGLFFIGLFVSGVLLVV
ncbi:MAG: hypothetical protein ACRDBG_06160 [Waterburya sp.]